MLSDGTEECDVEFRSEAACGIEPPDPQFLELHAAFAKVLHLSGAADYFEDIESEVEDSGTLCPGGESNIGAILFSRLAAITAH